MCRRQSCCRTRDRPHHDRRWRACSSARPGHIGQPRRSPSCRVCSVGIRRERGPEHLAVDGRVQQRQTPRFGDRFLRKDQPPSDNGDDRRVPVCTAKESQYRRQSCAVDGHDERGPRRVTSKQYSERLSSSHAFDPVTQLDEVRRDDSSEQSGVVDQGDLHCTVENWSARSNPTNARYIRLKRNSALRFVDEALRRKRTVLYELCTSRRTSRSRTTVDASHSRRSFGEVKLHFAVRLCDRRVL